MSNLDIDQTIQAIDCVKNIVDNIRCPICDKKDGQRLRYPCGHTVCNVCVTDLEDCPICLITSPTSSPKPKPDDALTQRVKNASVLLQACEDLFHTDVYTRKRLSEQLKIEKELFPECIQAPIKYENKRKSKIISPKNKKHKYSSSFTGEEASPQKENMENSTNYVQQWLSKNEENLSRKPLTDLNVNTQFESNVRLRGNNNAIQTKKDENVPVLKSNRKRSHFKTTVNNVTPQRKLNNKSDTKHRSKRVKKEIHQSYNIHTETQKESDNDESVIFIDSALIDDSQETVIDKDRNAWLAVLEANKNEEIESTSEVNLDHRDVKSLNSTYKQTPVKYDAIQCKENQRARVPFYKKSYIRETCKYCDNRAYNVANKSKKTKVTINNDKFSTTINILNDSEERHKIKTTNSVLVQTDISETIELNDVMKCSDVIELTNINEKGGKEDVPSQKSVCISDTQSEDLFADEEKNVANKLKRDNTNNVVIEESDSDTEMEACGPLPVKVDVHRSCDESEYGVLSEIVNIQEHDTRPRRRPRRQTPASTDSSEKENLNPNRMKKSISKKKKKEKK